METTRCLIIGSGPAGFTAGIYASRADLKPLLYEGEQPGGQLTITTEIENFPGYPEGVDGTAMMEDLRRQAAKFGTEIRSGYITKIDLSHRPFTATDDHNNTIVADTVIIATGASAKWIGLDSERQYYGQGVSACATCDGYFYRNKIVAVVGGGDTACEEANYLSNLCQKVYLVHRRNELRASKAMQHLVLDNPKIEMVWDSRVHLIGGTPEQGVTHIELENVKDNSISTLKVDGVFVAIGHKPNTDFLDNQVELDPQGYIKQQSNTTQTNIPGVFAAGDVCDPSYRQAIVAAGRGCMAALDAERFLQGL
ncbi:MAG: thioredoxin-disulfide reductase [Bacteroidales bacterium]|nr:thioredoxin-disulfide reductase [Bacteroidales bacterium]